MKKLLIGAVAATGLAIASVPASAEFYAGADPGGVGVQVGPFGVGVGPRFAGVIHDHYRGYYAYGRRLPHHPRADRYAERPRDHRNADRDCY